MVDWFPEGLPAKTQIIPSENGFTSDKIALEYLQHYIDNSDSGPKTAQSSVIASRLPQSQG